MLVLLYFYCKREPTVESCNVFARRKMMYKNKDGCITSFVLDKKCPRCGQNIELGFVYDFECKPDRHDLCSDCVKKALAFMAVMVNHQVETFTKSSNKEEGRQERLESYRFDAARYYLLHDKNSEEGKAFLKSLRKEYAKVPKIPFLRKFLSKEEVEIISA